MKKTTVIIFIVLVVAAFASGFFIKEKVDSLRVTEEIKAIAEKYPGLDVSPCTTVPADINLADSAGSCLGGLLSLYALAQKNIVACDDIIDGSLKILCQGRVTRVLSLSEQGKLFCQGVSTDELCGDLALTLLASETSNADHCLKISNDLQRTTCLTLINPSLELGQLLPDPPEQEIAESGTPVIDFGLLCLEGDETCQNAIPVFNRAVASSNSSLCDTLGVFADSCLYELVLYISFLSNDPTSCQTRRPAEVCQIDLAIARALEDRNSQPCNQLGNPSLAQFCNDTLKSTPSKRFDYLDISQ